MSPRRPCSPLFPYTTLFRSGAALAHEVERLEAVARLAHDLDVVLRLEDDPQPAADQGLVVGDENSDHVVCGSIGRRARTRSEEHTSELQSLRHLVCRLLLEK